MAQRAHIYEALVYLIIYDKLGGVIIYRERVGIRICRQRVSLNILLGSTTNWDKSQWQKRLVVIVERYSQIMTWNMSFPGACILHQRKNPKFKDLPSHLVTIAIMVGLMMRLIFVTS